MSHPLVRLLAWLGRALLLLLGVTLPLLVLLALPLLLEGSAQGIEGPAGRLWLIVFVLLLTLGLLTGAWVLLKHLLLAPFGAQGLFGDTPLARLLGLGLASLAFPRAASGVVQAPFYLLSSLWSTLPDRSTSFVNRVIGSNVARYPLDELSYRMLEALQMFGYEVARAINTLLAQWPMPECLLWLATWALAGQLFSQGAEAQTGGARAPMRLLAWLRGLAPSQQHALGLSLVFLVGAFFCAASIVAIPWLQDEHVPANLNGENLSKALQAAATRPEDAQRLLGIEAASKPSVLEALKPQLEQPSDPPAGARTAAAPPVGREQFRQGLDGLLQERQKAQQRAGSLGKSMLSQQEKLQAAALRAFETELSLPMSSQERLNFYKDIQRAFAAAVGSQARQLADCARALSELELRGERLRDQLGELLRRAETRSEPYWDALTELSRINSAYGSVCQEQPSAPVEFLTPEPGAGWGPFGLIATWLLRTRSMALTLVTGMLGFGLLGAAISTVVRSDIKQAERPAIEEVGRIVVRGLSAALVVFLAVKGGLAVFTAGESSPNAYVLFFTCLVGAVFSDDVWLWARERLRRSTEGEGGAGQRGASGKAQKGEGDGAAGPQKPAASGPGVAAAGGEAGSPGKASGAGGAGGAGAAEGE